MPRITIPFVGGQSVAKSVAVNNQETVNLIQAVKSFGAKSGYVLESAPGLIDRGSVGTGPCRSTKMVNSAIRGSKDLYGVFGNQLVAFGPVGSGHTVIGSLDTSTGQVVIAAGRTHVAVVDGVDMYTYDGTTFGKVTDLDFPGNFVPPGRPTHVVYIDGFFVVNDADSDNWFLSAREDPTSWNGLDFDAASVSPDAALAVAARASILWLIGESSAEAYYNSGNPDFPYDIILTATQEAGILAPFSLAESDDGIFYLATTPEGGRFVHRIQGQAGSTVSSDEEEDFLATLEDPTDAVGYIYKQAGKSFYVLQVGSSPGKATSTRIYNIKAGQWEAREINDGTAWRINGHGILANKNIGGSRLSGQSLELDLNTFEDAGQEIIRRRRTQIYHVNNHSMDWWELVVDVEPGVGLTIGQGSIPILLMRYSDDSGVTWSSYLQGEIGKIGETGRRLVFRNLGQSRNRVFEIQISDPVPFTVINAYAVAEALED